MFHNVRYRGRVRAHGVLETGQSRRSQIVASGGSTRVAWAGCPFWPPSCAVTEPRFPTPEPVYVAASVLTTSPHSPAAGSPSRKSLCGRAAKFDTHTSVLGSPLDPPSPVEPVETPRRMNENTFRPASL